MLAGLNDYFRVQETALKLRSVRQELIASNLANADTPNYKARDIDFGSAFNAALEGRSSAALATSNDRHMQVKSAGDIFPSSMIKYRGELQSSVDGNTVNVDKEMVDFADNSLRYQAALTFMQKRIETMKTALQNN